MRHVPSARRLLLTALLAILLLPAVPAAAQAACRGADTPVAATSMARARAAVLCLHNQVRRAHHLRPLRAEADLQSAATAYSQGMVRRRFFSHVSPTGSTLLGRARSAGYLDRAFSFFLGENIAWGEGRLGTPRSILRGWMHSPGHRHNILDPRFRDVGIGLALGTPAGSNGATYTTDFGVRG